LKRLKVILALALALGMMVTIFVAPALANNNNNNNNNDLNCRDARGNLIRCDGELFRPVNDNHFNNVCCDFHDNNFVGVNPFGFNTFANCGHWEWHWVFDRWEWEDDCD